MYKTAVSTAILSYYSLKHSEHSPHKIHCTNNSEVQKSLSTFIESKKMVEESEKAPT